MASQSHKAEIESWAVVFGLSDRTVELAKQLLLRVIGRKVYSMSKPLLALYAASIMNGEYIPLTYFISVNTGISIGRIRIRPRFVRFDLKKHFGIELSPEKLVAIETRGFCRVLKLDPLTCEASVCTAVNTFNEPPSAIRRSYTTFVIAVIRLVARHLQIEMSLPRFLRYPTRMPRVLIVKRARKYVDACIERARQSMQLG